MRLTNLRCTLEYFPITEHFAAAHELLGYKFKKKGNNLLLYPVSPIAILFLSLITTIKQADIPLLYLAFDIFFCNLKVLTDKCFPIIKNITQIDF